MLSASVMKSWYLSNIDRMQMSRGRHRCGFDLGHAPTWRFLLHRARPGRPLDQRYLAVLYLQAGDVAGDQATARVRIGKGAGRGTSRSRIPSKLGVSSHTEAAALAVQHDLVT